MADSFERSALPSKRDNFSASTVLQIAKRAGWLCSFPSCRVPTVGAAADGEGVINIGTAAHIGAAAKNGPRYDEGMTPEERASASNGIWLCRDHGKAIDSDPKVFTTPMLREWKKQAETESWQRVLRHETPIGPTVNTGLNASLRAAAEADLKVFQNKSKWPRTTVPLTLQVQGFDDPVESDALAVAVVSLDDLILVANPGMGKTTTLFQLAKGVIEASKGVPIVVPLGEWATAKATILNSILGRPAFKGIDEDAFRRVAAEPGVVLLLDGWNELDADARKAARIQIDDLKGQLPHLGLIISTRQPRNESVDIPFGGTRVDLLPLSEERQADIARAINGDAGEKMLEQAWRTPGIRELVAIPLYLTALLSLPAGAPFPTTKEEVLRHFVAAHEKQPTHAEALHAVLREFPQEYLESLAVFATRASRTSVHYAHARRLVSETADMLIVNGQIAKKPEQGDVVEVLVNSHVLMRAGDTPGVMFQHQQFQEWYASHHVQRLIMSGVDDMPKRNALKAEIFNLPQWGEAILFSVERMSRGNAAEGTACGKAIVAAFEVDPILAAEMIFRATDTVWVQIATTITGFVKRWHTTGKNDRALRFMLTSGRADFLDIVWPIISDPNEQRSLGALRNCRRFRPSILGPAAEKKIKGLLSAPRKVLLYEIASHSGIDGIELAARIAKDDPDPEVQSTVVDALAFRRADRHVAIVLSKASDEAFDLVHRKGLLEEIEDAHVLKGVAAARARERSAGVSHYDRLRGAVYAPEGAGTAAEITALIAEMEIDRKAEPAVNLIYEVRKRYPEAVAQGVLQRVRDGKSLFYGADNIVAAANITVDDPALLEVAINSADRHDDRAEAAASVLGPESVGKMIDEKLEAYDFFQQTPRVRDEAMSNRYYSMRDRIAHTLGTSLLAAVEARAETTNGGHIEEMAGLLARRDDGDSDRARPFDAAGHAAIGNLIRKWGERLLASGSATRNQLASLAHLAACSPSPDLLPILKRLLDEELRLYRASLEDMMKPGHGGRMLTSQSYQQAFTAIVSPDTSQTMYGYLHDEHFGGTAAIVLKVQWIEANEPKDEKRMFRSTADYSAVESKRAARGENPSATCPEAETMFAAIETLVADGSAPAQQKLAVEIGIQAARIPHADRPEIIRKLLGLTHQRLRATFVTNLLLSGEPVAFETVKQGIDEVLKEAEKHAWILSEGGHQLKAWLPSLPFCDQPGRLVEVIRALPDRQRAPDFLEEMLYACSHASSPEVEEALFALAESDARFYDNHAWREAIFRRKTPTAARRYVDLIVSGQIKVKGHDDWQIATRIGVMLEAYLDLRAHVYGLLRGEPGAMLGLLARAVAESADAEGLLLLVELENKHKRSLISWQRIQSAVTEHVPSTHWKGAFEVIPINAAELRAKLLSMTTDGGPHDAAARVLTTIDKVRDEYGAADDEPRHPDLGSGKAWPIMTPDPEAEG